mmetsp:Transcript_4914/g.7346  ORF Transcript_4914/g.7346 Transcript_4914/m.7346 type:complete len:220 (-) Transcript_4914:137-796(-)
MLYSRTAIALVSADSCIGRVDKSCFSNLTLMEMLIQDVTNKHEICGHGEEPADISDWKSVILSENGVEKIDWSFKGLQGTLHIEWLPPSVKTLMLIASSLEGSFAFGDLPTEMTHLDLFNNDFSGEMDFSELPDTMEFLDASYNSLYGSLNFEALPRSIVTLSLKGNSFVGSINLTRLPDAIQVLDVAGNQLEGTIDVTCLPSSLVKLLQERFFREHRL